MSREQRIQKIEALKSDFRAILEFHETSFRDIDAKSKYWLSLTLPAFIALTGYFSKYWASSPLPLLTGGFALAACLFISIYLFSSALLSLRVESGILAPSTHQFSDATYFLESDEKWLELAEDQAQEMLRAISNNKNQNARKSLKMRRGEVSLFRGSPTAICLAGGGTFAYTAACPSGLTSTGAGIATSGAIAGIVVGTGTAAAFIAVDYFFTLRRNNPKT